MQLNSEYELGVRDQIEEKREHAAIKIQHFWRGIMAKAAAQVDKVFVHANLILRRMVI